MTERDAQRVVLVSGFEVFGDHAVNPSGDAVRALARRGAQWAAARGVVPVVLPVTYRGAFTVLAARAAREGAAGCLMFGLGHAGPVRVERCAYNTMTCALPDNAGVLREGAPIAPGGADVLTTEGPREAVLAALADAGADAVHSDDPGRFVCNATYYAALAGGAAWSRRALFVHLPPTRALGGAVDQQAIERWVEAAVEAYRAAL